MGGIPTLSGVTRFGIAYRSDRLSNLTEADGTALLAMGIVTIIDMRNEDERERAPNRLPASLHAQQISRDFLPRHTLGMFDAINSGAFDSRRAYETMLLQYEALALEHTDDYRRIIDDLLAPEAVPAIFHCTSGKDRTGMIAAIVLLALGASCEAITADYVMTHDRIEKVDYFQETADPGAIAVVMAADADYMETALASMRDRYGSTDRYLSEGVGVTPEKRRRLAQLFIDA